MRRMLKQVAFGLATYVPGVVPLWQRALYRFQFPGAMSARYCYSVWLRHLVIAHQNGLGTQPNVVAELGPGNSLGVGAAALISGSRQYVGLDIVQYASDERTLTVFDELVRLFRAKADIPGVDEFPEVKPYLDNYAFPFHILTNERLAAALKEDRIASLRDALATLNAKSGPEAPFRYLVPWDDDACLETESADMILSQAVLEHVDQLASTYRSMHRMLKPDGFLSHQIDYRAHGTASKWNGHWAYADLTWKVIRGGQTYVINRQPHSAHISQLAAT